jgi:uncharacterized protein DUF4339
MDLRQLVRAFDAGRVDADTLVWRKGMPDWRRLRDVSELAERLLNNPTANAAAGETTGRIASEPPRHEAHNSGSEPPPRQSERSRTPPASYTVGAGSSGSDASATGSASYGAVDAASTEGRLDDDRRLDAEGPSPDAPTAEGRPSATPAEAALRPSRSSLPPAEADHRASRTSVAPGDSSLSESVKSIPGRSPSSAPRPHARRRGKTPSRPNASPLAPSRTVTRTGLESPAQVVARNSTHPPASAESEGSDADATRPSLASAAGRARDSRTDSRTSAPPGGARRPQSSDETPAQKPSSLSVPPGGMEADQPRPRNRRLLALAAVVLGSAIIVRAFTSGGDAPVSAQQRTEAVVAAKQVEKALAPDPTNKSAGLSPRDGAVSAAHSTSAPELPAVPSSPQPSLAPPAAAQPPHSPTAAVVTAHPAAPAQPSTLVPQPSVAEVQPAAPASAPSRPSLGVTPTRSADSVATVGMVPPAPAVSSPATHPSDTAARPAVIAGAAGSPVAAPKASPAPAGVAPVAAAPATAAPATGGAAAPPAPAGGNPAPAQPSPAPPSAGAPAAATNAPPAAAPAPAGSAAVTQPSAPPGAPSAVPATPPARPFDVKAATHQLESAAVKAAACAGAGSTRGTGRVTVAIEPWGRVGRVTHLNQDFVGTPVGLCVMQAFQQIQVPPFDGATQAIPGAFNVE